MLDIKILTTPMYDMTQYNALGAVLINYVSSISVYRQFISRITQFTGGNNQAFQKFVDKLQSESLDNFINKISIKYPSTVMVVDFKTNITVVQLGKDQDPFPFMTISGTCLAPKIATNLESTLPNILDNKSLIIGGKRSKTRRRK
jgi:uncharacterized protein YbjQ (UPF0145 family)